MAYAPTKITIFKDGNTPSTGTQALGSLFEAEFLQLYGNWDWFFSTDGIFRIDQIRSKSGAGINIHDTGVGANLFRFTNATTTQAASRGFEWGLDASEQGRIWNYENTNIVIGTNNTERMRVLADGKVGIGTSAPGNLLSLAISAVSSTIENYSYSNDASSSGFLYLGKSRSATIGVLSETQSGDRLGGVWFRGINSSNTMVSAAQITVYQEAASGATYIPSYISFLTATNAATATERMRITSAGFVGIGVTPSNPLHVQSTTTPQFRVAYDDTYYGTIACSSAGILTLTAVGSLALGSGISSTVLISNTTECTGADTGALQVDGGADFALHVNMQTNLTVGTGIVAATGNIEATAGFLIGGKGKKITGKYVNASATLYSGIWEALIDELANTNDEINAQGVIKISTSYWYICSIQKYNSNTMRFFGYHSSSSADDHFDITNTGGTTVDGIWLSW